MFSVTEDFTLERLNRESESGLRMSWGGWCRNLAQTTLAQELVRDCEGREDAIDAQRGPVSAEGTGETRSR